MTDELIQSSEVQLAELSDEQRTSLDRKPRSRRALLRRQREEIKEKDSVIDDLTQTSEMDHLTEIRNLRGFYSRLAEDVDRMGRSKEPLTFLMLDVNDFKTVNDEKGHTYGDAVLKKVAKTISNCIRLGDTVARLGGDEFALLLPNIKSGDLFKIWGRISEALGKNDISVGAGAVNLNKDELPDPKKGREIDTRAKKDYLEGLTDKLVGRAHEPMYRAKFDAKNAQNPNFGKCILYSELPA
jgi:diguanylate cyclase (GGDEF)-like protein